MLAKQEQVIVETVLLLCGDKKATLISRNELNIKINESLSERKQIDADELEKSLRQLELDGYFDIIDSDRKGQKTYCITVHEKAEALPREREQTKRKVVFDLKIKLILAVVGALVTFLVGIILKTWIHC